MLFPEKVCPLLADKEGSAMGAERYQLTEGAVLFPEKDEFSVG